MTEQLKLLEKLTNANGVSGYEKEIRLIMKEELEKVGAEISYDNLGSIIGCVKGNEVGPKVLVAGHMDEIGLMITSITEEGFLKFQPVGGWWGHVMLSQQFNILTSNGKVYKAVTGSKPPHILGAEEKTRVLKLDDMYLDMGVESKEEVEKLGVKVGDQVVPAISFQQMANPDYLLAKAFDNRFGCAVAIEVAKELKKAKHENIYYGVGTVQEEVGLRGAKTVANLVQPDVVFALDVTIASDTPGMSKGNKMGNGPVILLKDGALIGHVGLREFVVNICNELQIPYQIDYLPAGGTDAGAMHVANAGAPSMSLCVASRYIHSHTSMISKKDYENTIKLLVAVIQRLDQKALEQIKFA